MHFKINHDLSKKTLVLPRAALQLSKTEDEKTLDLLVGSGYILVKREDLSVAESMEAIDQFSELTVSLLVQLAQESRRAAKRGNCSGCEEDCDLMIPPCLLEQAGIDPDEGLDTAVEDGRVIVTAAEPDVDMPDPLEGQEEDVLGMLEDCGVDLDGLRMLLRQEGEKNG